LFADVAAERIIHARVCSPLPIKPDIVRRKLVKSLFTFSYEQSFDDDNDQQRRRHPGTAPSGMEVGIYAAAAQTGAFISLIGTSTNRYFLPVMVVLIEQRDKQAIRELINRRALTVGGLILLLLIAIFLLGEKILMLFGAHFKAGYEALVIIAVGASVSALYADIPYYLQFMGFKRTVFNATALATITMIALSFWLGPEYGPFGVATAYMTPVAVLFITLRLISVRHFHQL
jgi:O-antigen/teichoic acid export membrane protein